MLCSGFCADKRNSIRAFAYNTAQTRGKLADMLGRRVRVTYEGVVTFAGKQVIDVCLDGTGRQQAFARCNREHRIEFLDDDTLGVVACMKQEEKDNGENRE